MNKFQVIKQLRKNGDSIITMHGDIPDICATLEFKEKYIKRQRSPRFTIKKECILMYSWTDNSFKNIKITDIKSVMPLAALLKNQSPEIILDA